MIFQPGPKTRRLDDRRQDERKSRSKVEEFLKDSLAGRVFPDQEFLKEINRLTLLDSVMSGIPSGRYRDKPVVVRWRGAIVYRPPLSEKLPELMKNLFEYVARQCTSMTSPVDEEKLVERVGLFFLMILKFHPFLQGNGRTARAYSTYLLLQKGFQLRRGQSLETFIDQCREEYFQRLFRSSVQNPSHWIPFFSRAVGSVMITPSCSNQRARTSLYGLFQIFKE